MTEPEHGYWNAALSVVKYDHSPSMACDAVMAKHPNGNYVQSDDYKALQAANEILAGEVNRLNIAMMCSQADGESK